MAAAVSAPADVTFSTKNTTAQRAGRYALGSEIEVGRHESVATGADKDGHPFLVYISGRQQVGVPMYAVATAVASGSILSAAAIVGAFAEAGTLDKLAAAVKAATPPAKP